MANYHEHKLEWKDNGTCYIAEGVAGIVYHYRGRVEHKMDAVNCGLVIQLPRPSLATIFDNKITTYACPQVAEEFNKQIADALEEAYQHGYGEGTSDCS